MPFSRLELAGIAIGTAVSCAIQAFMVLYVAPRERVVIEVHGESAAPAAQQVTEPPRERGTRI